MNRNLILLIVFIAAGVAGGLWYFNQPEEKINGTVDDLFEAVAYKKVSLSNPNNVATKLEEILSDEVQIVADEVKVMGISFFSSGTLSREQVIEKVKLLHDSVSLCEFAEQARWLNIEGDEAQVSRTTKVKVAAGPKGGVENTYDLIFDLKKSDRWRITTIRAKKLD